MKYSSRLIGTIVCTALLVQSCSAFVPSSEPEPTPTPRCLNEAWSYFENTSTNIEITPGLIITIREFLADFFSPTGNNISTVIYGDGRVILDSVSTGSSNETSHFEKQLTPEQLEQIVALFEQVNFYAISPGCNGKTISVMDVDTLEISIETKEGIHTFKDNGACSISLKAGLEDYCDLAKKVQEIIGPWRPK